MKYEVFKHFRDDMEFKKEFTDLREALTYCFEDDTLCREDGHALSIRKNYIDSIFEINYYGNTEVNVDGVAVEEELNIINDFIGGIIMEKYFDIHVTYGTKDGDGYSIPIIANSEEDAKQKAINERLFEYEDDVNDIDYIEEITKDEYSEMKE